MNTQNKKTDKLINITVTILTFLGLFLTMILTSCSKNTCSGVISKKPVNKYIVKHSNFNKKHYNF